MAFVLDASVTIVWAMPDESHPVAELASQRLRIEPALVPAIWWYEVRNILIVNERRQRISTTDTTQFLQELTALPIVTSRPPVDEAILKLARSHKLTVYDAAYLEVALRLQLPLATLDAELQRAARAANLVVLN